MMSSRSRLADRWRTFSELVRALWNGPYWWLVPVVIFLAPLAALFLLLQAVPVVAPFVYMVF